MKLHSIFIHISMTCFSQLNEILDNFTNAVTIPYLKILIGDSLVLIQEKAEQSQNDSTFLSFTEFIWINPDYQKGTATPDLEPHNWSIFETFLLPLNWFNPQSEGYRRNPSLACSTGLQTEQAKSSSNCGQECATHVPSPARKWELSTVPAAFPAERFNPGTLGWISSQAGRDEEFPGSSSSGSGHWGQDSTRKRAGDRAGMF